MIRDNKRNTVKIEDGLILNVVECYPCSKVKINGCV